MILGVGSIALHKITENFVNFGWVGREVLIEGDFTFDTFVWNRSPNTAHVQTIIT